MKLISVRNGESRAGDRLIDQMHVLRAHVFKDRLGWDVTVDKNREADEYDALDPTYVLVVTPDATKVVGCARLLNGMGPTMLGRTFPVLLDGEPMPRHPNLIESSRFCIDTEQVDSGTARGLHTATLTLFAGILEWSIGNGYSEVATVTDLRFEKILGRAGLPFDRLGEPRQIGNTIAIAGIVPVTLKNAVRLRPSDYQSSFAEPIQLVA